MSVSVKETQLQDDNDDDDNDDDDDVNDYTDRDENNDVTPVVGICFGNLLGQLFLLTFSSLSRPPERGRSRTPRPIWHPPW